MDLVTGKFDINLFGNKPFVAREPSIVNLWTKRLQILSLEFPSKQLSCASDAYITDTPLRVNLSDVFGPTRRFGSPGIYISHVFHRNGESTDIDLDRIIPTPDCLGPQAIREFRIKRLVAGPPGTGTALHQHSRALFCNIEGIKRWFLAAPTPKNGEMLAEYAYDLKNKSIKSIRDWFAEDLTRLMQSLTDCCLVDLKPGEALYIPDAFYHAVLNIEFTTGVALSWEKESQVFST